MDFDIHDVTLLAQRAAAARRIVYAATGSAALRREIGAAYAALEGKLGAGVAVAIRSSAAAEDLPNASRPHTAIMINLGNPELAFHTAMLPNDSVGLARMEFIISEHIGIHPMALVHPERVTKSAHGRCAPKVATGRLSDGLLRG